MDREEMRRRYGSPPFYDSIEEYEMDWNKWCGYNLYKKLWSLIGGRPWTYIYRDLYRKYEYFIQLQWFVTGILVYHFLGLFGVWVFWGFYSFGYINGHFFWGRDIIEGQAGD